jgi:hypothetical protein
VDTAFKNGIYYNKARQGSSELSGERLQEPHMLVLHFVFCNLACYGVMDVMLRSGTTKAQILSGDDLLILACHCSEEILGECCLHWRYTGGLVSCMLLESQGVEAHLFHSYAHSYPIPIPIPVPPHTPAHGHGSGVVVSLAPRYSSSQRQETAAVLDCFNPLKSCKLRVL